MNKGKTIRSDLKTEVELRCKHSWKTYSRI